MTYAEKFVKNLEIRFGENFRHIALTDINLHGIEGAPKATAWDSHGDMEVVKFADGSTYEPCEVQFCKPAQ